MGDESGTGWPHAGRRLSGRFWPRPVAAVIGIHLLAGGVVRADATGAYRPGDPWWAGWNPDPVLLLNLALAGYLYQRGLYRLWRAGAGRGVAGWQAGCFVAGLIVLLVALASRLDGLAGELASAHMVQHMLVMNLAAPLVVLGSPFIVMLHGLPGPYRQSVGRLWRRMDPRGPAGPWLLYAAVLWGWHLPLMYEAALRSGPIHDLQHFTFFVASVLFWRAVLDRPGRRLGPGLGLVYLFTTSLHATVLGVFMALAPRPWYGTYAGRTEPWGLSPLEDQQLAGLIMWMPACLAYAIAAVGILAAWLQRPEEG